MDSNVRAVEFALDTHWNDLPEGVQHQSKRALLDNLGVLIAGGNTPSSRIVLAFVEDQIAGSGEQATCTVISTGKKVSAVGAALANGTAANGLDMDDGYNLAKGHPGAALLPALLASAELKNNVSGKDFLVALAVGYELAIRAAVIRHATYTTYHSTGSWGAIGGAAAGGKVLGLNPGQLGHAMGIAEYFAPIAPMMKGIDAVAMTKDSISWGAMVAMSSILLAARGFTGINPLFVDGPGPGLTGALGSDWLIMDLYHKPYACCYWAQAPIAGTLALIKAHGLAPEQIARITVYSFREAIRLLCNAPRDTEEAQYNLAYTLACAVLKGKLGPSEVTPPAIFEPQTLEFMDRIKPVEDAEIQKEFPARRQARVEITTSDGRVFDSGIVDAPWGTPANRPSDQDLIDKFREVTGPVLGNSRVQKLQDMIWNLDSQVQVNRLLDLASDKAA
ncbi:MAG: MmgE/PrpD family protein [Deltaproteobacteria bacterium]|nr:MmgE/PrpD family protein [Deltaproteobacteria bacterium]